MSELKNILPLEDDVCATAEVVVTERDVVAALAEAEQTLHEEPAIEQNEIVARTLVFVKRNCHKKGVFTLTNIGIGNDSSINFSYFCRITTLQRRILWSNEA